ncbi:hypothetical protein M9Y10_008179 [Tritrichomonas musculus]|uniref:Rap-GAP domain-containing protein n=1 Tax=Tritrichomonas musculus TaxID=1915356 RepID=A0ABR2IXK5_9EUKA
MSSKMKELSKKLAKSDGNLINNDILSFFNEFLIWLNSGFNKTRPLPKGQVQKFFMMSIPLLKDINLEVFVNLIPTLLKILAILIHPQTDKDIRDMVWKYSILLIDSKTVFVSYNSWTYLIDSAFSTKERDPNFNSGTPSTYSYESNSLLLINYLDFITSMCTNNPNIAHDSTNIKKKVIYHWELISELIFPHVFSTSIDNRKTLNQLCLQILQCINICQKTFKFSFFNSEIGGPKMIHYLLDVLIRVDDLSNDESHAENSFNLLYKFCKSTFPCQIFTIDQNSNFYECKKNQQITERITPTINRNYLFLSMNNNSINNNNNNTSNNNNSGSNTQNYRFTSNKPKFTINPLLLCCFDVIPSDEVIALLKDMSQNCKNYPVVIINSILIMIKLIYPLLANIQLKIKNINENLNSTIIGGSNNNADSNNNNTNNLKAIDQTYRAFINSPTNTSTIKLIADLFSHVMRLRSLIQVVIKSPIDSQTFSSIVSSFFNFPKKEMYPFLVTVFFSILFDRRYIDIKEERDCILLLMNFNYNMSYMPNLFARISSQISVALSTFILNLPENISREIQPNAILFDDKEIVNEVLVEIGKFSSDTLYFFFPFIPNEFSMKLAKDFLTNMIFSFDPLFNNYISMATAGAILAIIDWYKKKEKDKMNEQLHEQQSWQQHILNANLKLNLRRRKNRPKSHDFQQIKFSNIRFSTEYKKISSSLILPTVINEESSSTETTRNSNPVISLNTDLINSEDGNCSSNSGENISLGPLSPLTSSNSSNDNARAKPTSNNINNQKYEDDNYQNIPEIAIDNSFYINNVVFLKDLDLSYLFSFLLPYLMKSLAKTLDANNKETPDEINKNLNYFMSWQGKDFSKPDLKIFLQETDKEKKSGQEQEQKLRNETKKRMQIICFKLIFKIVKLAFECNLLTDNLARDWCRILIMYLNYYNKVLKEAPANEVVLAIIDSILNAYPMSFSLIPVLSQTFCNLNFASFQDHEKIKIIAYLVSVCTMIKKTIEKDKISFSINTAKANQKFKNAPNRNNEDTKCNFVDIRADTLAVLTHAFETFEGVSENIDAAAFSLFIDELYSSDETVFDLIETLVFSRLSQFEKKPSLTFSRLLIGLLPTHLDLVIKKCKKYLFDRLIEVPFNVLLKLEVKSTEIYENLSQCLVDIILTLQNGPIFNKTLAFITIETVPDENQKILFERTKFLIANFNKPNGIIDININNYNDDDLNTKLNETSNKQKHSYYGISQNGAFYCVKNYTKEEENNSGGTGTTNDLSSFDDNKNNYRYFIIESSLPLGSSRYKITPSIFLTVPQKSKLNNNFSDKSKNLPYFIPNVESSFMFSQIPSSALLFKVLSHFSQSTLKFSTTLKNGGRNSLSTNLKEIDSSTINVQNSFSTVPKPTKLLVSEPSNNNNNTNDCAIPRYDEKSTFRSKSMNNIALQKWSITDQNIGNYMKKIYKRSQRMQQIIGILYMEKGQILNLNANYCLRSDFFSTDKNTCNNAEDNESGNENNSDETNKNRNDSLDEGENGIIDNNLEDKLSFITQAPWNKTSMLFKEFLSSLGSFQKRVKAGSKKQKVNETDSQTDIQDECINVHYVDFHSDAIFLLSSFLGLRSFQNSKSEVSKSKSEVPNSKSEQSKASQEIKNNFWRIFKSCHVLIIWNEDNTNFRINDYFNNTDRSGSNSNNLMRAFIVVSPIRNNLFRVTVIEHFNHQQVKSQQQSQYLNQYLETFPNAAVRLDELTKMIPGPLFGDNIVPKRSLGELVRATAINEDRKIKSLIECKEKEELYIDNLIQEIENKKKGKKNAINVQLFDMKNQKMKKKKNSPSNEEIFSDLWKDFPQSFSFYY